MEFHNRATGKVHTTLISPDGGMVHGVHENIVEAHKWASDAIEVGRSGNPPQHKNVETWLHKSDTDGSIIGVGQAHSYRSVYLPATRG